MTLNRIILMMEDMGPRSFRQGRGFRGGLGPAEHGGGA